MNKLRSSGVLMHISSLPGKYGIGDFGIEAYNFIDFLAETKQKNWQILPLGITSFGDSPYQSFSAFAGNPYFIDLDEFIQRGYLSSEEIASFDLGNDPTKVDYGLLYKNKMELIKRAYNRGKVELEKELYDFYIDNLDWLGEFALFMAIKDYHNNKSWLYWDKDYRIVDSAKVKEFKAENQDKIFFWVFTQYFFYNQWLSLKNYANENGISIIGDLPIYVAEDSVDIWANSEIFYLDKDLFPVIVSGCPPDAFSVKGQLWGNPIYNWKALEEDNYSWWIKRFEYSFKLYDILRIDHFRGFESYWEVEYGSEDAIIGKWTKGPGIKLFKKLGEELGDLNIIAEDLGFLTEDVKALLEEASFPGMKVLQFAFDSREESDYLPHNYDKNCVVYTGTHDNSTIEGWFSSRNKEDREYAIKYLKLNYDEGINWGFIRGAWSSTANLAITTMQDILALDDRARMNTPSTIGNNWLWRMEKSQVNDEIIRKLGDLTKLYGR
ncbi:MAG: 4-alpha-glucanotransferase [Tissierellia bacterium]|nr:4-alpha-glucanotransferase [Tissierellia bacterium]